MTGAGRSARRPRGGGPERAAPPARQARSWRERVDDPDEPLFTMAVATELLALDAQSLRRLSAAIDHDESRPSGNQRRYSRNDLERLSAAADLAAQGHSGQSISTILDLTARLEPDPSG